MLLHPPTIKPAMIHRDSTKHRRTASDHVGIVRPDLTRRNHADGMIFPHGLPVARLTALLPSAVAVPDHHPQNGEHHYDDCCKNDPAPGAWGKGATIPAVEERVSSCSSGASDSAQGSSLPLAARLLCQTPEL